MRTRTPALQHTQCGASVNMETRGREIACPFCKSTDTEMISLFGMQLMTTQHYCHNCHSAFEAVKWEEPKQEAKSDKPEA